MHCSLLEYQETANGKTKKISCDDRSGLSSRGPRTEGSGYSERYEQPLGLDDFETKMPKNLKRKGGKTIIPPDIWHSGLEIDDQMTQWEMTLRLKLENACEDGIARAQKVFETKANDTRSIARAFEGKMIVVPKTRNVIRENYNRDWARRRVLMIESDIASARLSSPDDFRRGAEVFTAKIRDIIQFSPGAKSGGTHGSAMHKDFIAVYTAWLAKEIKRAGGAPVTLTKTPKTADFFREYHDPKNPGQFTVHDGKKFAFEAYFDGSTSTPDTWGTSDREALVELSMLPARFGHKRVTISFAKPRKQRDIPDRSSIKIPIPPVDGKHIYLMHGDEPTKLSPSFMLMHEVMLSEKATPSVRALVGSMFNKCGLPLLLDMQGKVVPKNMRALFIAWGRVHPDEWRAEHAEQLVLRGAVPFRDMSGSNIPPALASDFIACWLSEPAIANGGGTLKQIRARLLRAGIHPNPGPPRSAKFRPKKPGDSLSNGQYISQLAQTRTDRDASKTRERKTSQDDTVREASLAAPAAVRHQDDRCPRADPKVRTARTSAQPKPARDAVAPPTPSPKADASTRVNARSGRAPRPAQALATTEQPAATAAAQEAKGWWNACMSWATTVEVYREVTIAFIVDQIRDEEFVKRIEKAKIHFAARFTCELREKLIAAGRFPGCELWFDYPPPEEVDTVEAAPEPVAEAPQVNPEHARELKDFQLAIEAARKMVADDEDEAFTLLLWTHREECPAEIRSHVICEFDGQVYLMSEQMMEEYLEHQLLAADYANEHMAVSHPEFVQKIIRTAKWLMGFGFGKLERDHNRLRDSALRLPGSILSVPDPYVDGSSQDSMQKHVDRALSMVFTRSSLATKLGTKISSEMRPQYMRDVKMACEADIRSFRLERCTYRCDIRVNWRVHPLLASMGRGAMVGNVLSQGIDILRTMFASDLEKVWETAQRSRSRFTPIMKNIIGITLTAIAFFVWNQYANLRTMQAVPRRDAQTPIIGLMNVSIMREAGTFTNRATAPETHANAVKRVKHVNTTDAQVDTETLAELCGDWVHGVVAKNLVKPRHLNGAADKPTCGGLSAASQDPTNVHWRIRTTH